MQLEINKTYNEDCLVTMGNMSNEFVDLTITSPPYDNLRNYNGYSFDFENIAKELFRVTKNGGVVVWVVSDATINGSESGSSFKQALYFIQCGFNLHDTMIWDKGTFSATGSLKVRYAPVFEYMFVLVKGKLKTFNPIKDKINKHFGKIFSTSRVRQKDGSTRERSNKEKPTNQYGQRHNIWQINTGKPIGNHPAIFPEKLAEDHIISWSNEGDLVYDCFMGSGTTAKMAILNNRNWLGSEISSEYCEIIEERLKNKQTKLF